MKRVVLIVLILAISLTMLSSDKQIVMVGSTTVFPIAQATAEFFMDDNPDIDITVRGGGSGTGIAAIIDGTTNIGLSSRDIRDSEVENAKNNGVIVHENIVAFDGLAIIVNPANKLSKLTKQQIKDIFTGKIRNFKEVGGNDEAIIIVSRDVSSGTFETFKDIILGGDVVVDEAIRAQSNQSVVTTVRNTRAAIGYVGLGYISSDVKAVEVDGVFPNAENTASRKYPIVRALHMYTNGPPSGLTKQYFDFVYSPEGEKIVEELGFVPVPR